MSHYSRLGLAIVLVAFLMAAGCGRYKEEAETARKKVEQLSSQNRLLEQKVSQLEDKDKKATKDFQSLEKQSTEMSVRLRELSQTKERLSQENKKRTETLEKTEKELAELKRENKELTRKVEDLKKKQTVAAPPALAHPEPSPVTAAPRSVEPMPAKGTGTKQTVGTPCDTMIQYMRKAQGVIRSLRGEERSRMLKKLQQEHSAAMEGAPKKAIAAANKWVNELCVEWDKASDDGVFKLISYRNEALKACGKKPSEAGF